MNSLKVIMPDELDPNTERFVDLLNTYGSEPRIRQRLMEVLESYSSGCEERITFQPEDKFGFFDERGDRILSLDFEMSPGDTLIRIQALDTDGYPTATFCVDYFGPGYVQCGPPDQQRLIKQVDSEPYLDPIYKQQG